MKRLVDAEAEISPEVMLDIPFITISGDMKFFIENYLGIISFSEKDVKINTKSAIVKITGENFSLYNITDEFISVGGKIKAIEFI